MVMLYELAGGTMEYVDKCITAVANSIDFSFVVGGVASLAIMVFVVFFKRGCGTSPEGDSEEE